MKPTLRLSMFLWAALFPLQLTAESELQKTRSVLDNWIETQRIVSREKSDWRVEEIIIRDTKTVLENELFRLDEILADFESSATSADEERAELAAKKEELLKAAGKVEATIAELEAQVKAIVKTLPTPLVDIIKPLIRRLPEDPANTKSSIGERVQNVVGILSQADKFNSSLVRTSESRQVAEGKVVEVRTLYWGLAMAYYVDASGEFAGIGEAGEEGWKWTPMPGVGPSIQELLDVYEGVSDIRFVSVPARIK